MKKNSKHSGVSKERIRIGVRKYSAQKKINDFVKAQREGKSPIGEAYQKNLPQKAFRNFYKEVDKE